MQSAAMLNEIKTMNHEFIRLTGHEAYGYVSNPTKTDRVVFHDGHVALGLPEGHAYMAALLATAREDPTKLPYPLCTLLPPSQDARNQPRWAFLNDEKIQELAAEAERGYDPDRLRPRR